MPESEEQPQSADEISLTPPPPKEEAPQGEPAPEPAPAPKAEGKAPAAAPVKAAQKPAAKAAAPLDEEPVFPTAIYAIKTSIGHEKTVADGIAIKAKREKVEVFSILSPAPMRGYVYLEGVNPDRLTDLVKGVKRARGMVRARGTTDAGASAIPIEEIAHFLEPKPLVSGIVEGNIVEITQGPFKGEKARVIQIDEQKEEITVELIEAMISIPITVRGDAVRVLEKEEDREDQDTDEEGEERTRGAR
jgi:transcriptional antiterminator NusG